MNECAVLELFLYWHLISIHHSEHGYTLVKWQWYRK